MSSSEKRVRYQKGVNLELDKKFQEYKKKRLFQGYSYIYALSQKEIDLLIKLWKIERTRPRRLSFDDVSKLVDFTARIEECRNCQKREQTRLRVERSRGKREVTKKNKDTKVNRTSRIPLKTRSVRKRKRTGVKADAPVDFRKNRLVKQRRGSGEKISVSEMQLS